MLRGRLTNRFIQLGRTPPPPIDIDVLLNAFEYVGFRVALGDADAEWARTTMARVAVVLLGTTADLELAMAVPGLLRV
jgi:hypothetical protein